MGKAQWGFNEFAFTKVAIINLSLSDDAFFYLRPFDTNKQEVTRFKI